MIIFPAIDLKNGQCVRLTQGDFSSATIYESDPLLQAKKFHAAGASWLHLVDLDGAKAGVMQQFDIIERLAKSVPLKIQVGGGISETKIIEKLLNAGVQRVIIGSLAVKNQPLVKEWLSHFGRDVIVLAFDVRLDPQNTPEILTHGWQSGSNQSLWDLGQIYVDCGLKTILCTDVSRDGMLAGTNHTLYQMIQKQWPHINILASGGVDSIEDLLQLARFGCAGAITGKALYEGRFNLTTALQQVAHAC